MTIKEEIRDNIAILYLKGNMMGGPESMEVHEKVKSLLGDKLFKIVIDLSKVKWMNSSGLGILISGYSSVKNKNGNMKLAKVNKMMQGILVMTKLDTIFDSYNTVVEAIKSF